MSDHPTARIWLACLAAAPLLAVLPADPGADEDERAAVEERPGAAERAVRPAPEAHLEPPTSAGPEAPSSEANDAAVTDAEAQFQRGLSLLVGRGVEPDPAAAADWFQKAARQGHTRAQVNLGMSYKLGRGVPRDPTRAYHWLGKAAAAGHPKALFELGVAHRDGRGLPRDLPRAYMYLTLSAERGGLAARPMLRQLAGSLADAELAEAERLLAEWRAQPPG